LLLGFRHELDQGAHGRAEDKGSKGPDNIRDDVQDHGEPLVSVAATLPSPPFDRVNDAGLR
jgi:hypothetical protein